MTAPAVGETPRPARESERRSVIVGVARTPIGKFLGGLADVTGAELGAVAIRAALERAGVGPADVEYVILGQVLQAGAGQVPARQAAVGAGIPMTVPCLSINKVCLSGLNAIALADQLIRAGEHEIVVAGGMESMSQAPHLLKNARTGTKYGTAPLLDSLAYDGLRDYFTGDPMGVVTDRGNAALGISRVDQDAYAARSQSLAAAAAAEGRFDAELVPVQVRDRRGGPVSVTADEGIRPDTTRERLAALPPAFSPDGTITAGSASQISDGAAAVVVMSASKAAELGITPLATIGAYATVAGPDSGLHSQPARAIAKAAARQGMAASDFDLVEINEAFASVVLQSVRELGLDLDRVNVDGGGIALGHPVGASGARILVHAVLELRRRGGGLGVAALCGGGGQGDALIVEVDGA